MLQRQNIKEQIISRFTPASDLKIGTSVLIPNFNTQKEISKKITTPWQRTIPNNYQTY